MNGILTGYNHRLNLTNLLKVKVNVAYSVSQSVPLHCMEITNAKVSSQLNSSIIISWHKAYRCTLLARSGFPATLLVPHGGLRRWGRISTSKLRLLLCSRVYNWNISVFVILFSVVHNVLWHNMISEYIANVIIPADKYITSLLQHKY